MLCLPTCISGRRPIIISIIFIFSLCWEFKRASPFLYSYKSFGACIPWRSPNISSFCVFLLKIQVTWFLNFIPPLHHTFYCYNIGRYVVKNPSLWFLVFYSFCLIFLISLYLLYVCRLLFNMRNNRIMYLQFLLYTKVYNDYVL